MVAADTLTTVTDALVKLINKAPDPNVIAGANDITNTVVLTARTPGQPGANITLAAIRPPTLRLPRRPAARL